MNRDKDRLESAAARSDEDLIGLVRSGDVEAYGVLYQRHHSVAIAVARKNSDNRSDAEDAVSEAFSSVLQALQTGKGPVSFFRAYLLSAVTRIAHRRNVASGKVAATDDAGLLDRESTDPDSVLADFESDAVAKAYRTLPERWQAVLWYVDIEGMKPAAAAPLLGLSANGVSALAIRAREGLRKAYLQNHVSAAEDDLCAGPSAKLGSYAMNTLRRSQRAEVKEHLDDCLRCSAALLHLKDVGSAMRASVVPALLGLSYAAWSQLGSAAWLGDSALLFSAMRSRAIHLAGQAKAMGGGTFAASVTVMAGVSVVAVLLTGQTTGWWGSESAPGPGSQSQPGRSVPGIPVPSRGAPADSLQDASLVTASSTSGVEQSPGAPSPSANQPPAEPSESAAQTPLPSAFVPPVVQPTAPPTSSPPPVVQPVIPPVIPPTPPVTPPPALSEVSAEVTASGSRSRQNVQVAFKVTGSGPLVSAKVVFRLDPRLGQYFDGWTQQPKGWQCGSENSYTASCTAVAADRADLVFSGVVVVGPLTGKAMFTYEFSAAKVAEFSGKKPLDQPGGAPRPVELTEDPNGTAGSASGVGPDSATPTEPLPVVDPGDPGGPIDETTPVADQPQASEVAPAVTTTAG